MQTLLKNFVIWILASVNATGWELGGVFIGILFEMGRWGHFGSPALMVICEAVCRSPLFTRPGELVNIVIHKVTHRKRG